MSGKKLFPSQKAGRVMANTLIFSRQVDDVLAGRVARDSALILGDIPQVYLSLGVPRFKLVMTQGTLRKITVKHNVTILTIKRLPALLETPIMVFRSATEPDALVALINATDRNGNAVIAAIHPDRHHQQHRVNLIASVYGTNRARWFIDQIDEGRLLYADKEKALRWSRSARLQLPGEVTAARHSKIITPALHKVKENSPAKNAVTPRKKGSEHENQ